MFQCRQRNCWLFFFIGKNSTLVTPCIDNYIVIINLRLRDVGYEMSSCLTFMVFGGRGEIDERRLQRAPRPKRGRVKVHRDEPHAETRGTARCCRYTSKMTYNASLQLRPITFINDLTQ